jgi:hypothetical protein
VQIAQAGTIRELVELLGSTEERAFGHAAKALTSLGLRNEHNQQNITQTLIELLTLGTLAAQERAAKALWELRDQNAEYAEGIARAGDPAALVGLLQNGIADAKDYALWSLSLSIEPGNQAIVAEAGGVQPLIDQLADERPVVQARLPAAHATHTPTSNTHTHTPSAM